MIASQMPTATHHYAPDVPSQSFEKRPPSQMSSDGAVSIDDTLASYHAMFCQFTGNAPGHVYAFTEANIEAPISKARQKLQRLPRVYFAELATDVYDEMMRRLEPQPHETASLAPRPDIHRKRNEARQKLALLSATRFNDLATDILYEIENRYPQLRGSADDSMPSYESEPNRDSLTSAASVKTPQLPTFSFPAESPLDNRPISSVSLVSNATSRYTADENYHLRDSVMPPRTNGGVPDPAEPLPTLNMVPPMLQEEVIPPSNRQTPLTQPIKSTTIIPTKSTLVEDGSDTEDEAFSPDLDRSSFQNQPARRASRRVSTNGSLILTSIEEEEPNNHDHDNLSSKPVNRGIDTTHPGQQTPPHSDASDDQTYPADTTFDTVDSGANMTSFATVGQEFSMSPDEDYTESRDFAASHESLNSQDVSAEIKDKEEQIQMLVEEGSRMDDTINGLEAQLQESAEENGRLHDMVSELEEQRQRAVEERDELRKELEALQSNSTSPEAEATIASLQADKENHLRDLADAHQGHEQTKRSLETLQGEHSDLKSAIEQNQQAHEQLRSAHDDYKSKYEEQLAALKSHQDDWQAKESLMSQNSASLSLLQNTVAEHETTIARLNNELQKGGSTGDLQQQYEALVKDYARLQEEFEQQQNVTEQVRQEASEFLVEMRTLAENQRSMAASESLAAQIQSLKVEVQEWKSRYSRQKAQMRSLRSSTYGGASVFQPHMQLGRDNPYVSAEGRVRDISVTKFQIAVDEMLIKARQGHGDLLENLHNVVIATRNITQDLNRGPDEASSQQMPENVESQIAQCTSLVSKTANQLITTARNHRVSGGLSPLSILDAATSDLSFAVIELVKLARIRPSAEDGARDSFMSDDHHSAPMSRGMNGSSNVPDFHPIVTPPENIRMSLPPSGSEATFDIDDPDNTVAELQGYLEEQTAGAIDSIQSLLTGIKDGSSLFVLRPTMLNIVNLVDIMITATSTSMEQTRNWLLKDKGFYILQNLQDCSHRMGTMYDESRNLGDDTEPDRQLKQRLAGISFDMAKCTKELVKTVEEVSLTNDVNHIDRKIQHRG